MKIWKMLATKNSIQNHTYKRIENKKGLRENTEAPMILVLLIMLGCIIPMKSVAYSFVPTKTEWMAWPGYCRVRYQNSGVVNEFIGIVPRSEIEMWQKKLGQHMAGIHHYCAGLALIGRAKIAGMQNVKEGERLYKQAIGEIEYTKNRMKRGSPLWSDLYAHLGLAWEAIGEHDKAEKSFRNGIMGAPNAPASYIAWAQVLIQKGVFDDALTILLSAEEKLLKPSAELQYFLGYVYMELGEYEKAQGYARHAYLLGYPLQGLKEKLQEVGYGLD